MNMQICRAKFAYLQFALFLFCAAAAAQTNQAKIAFTFNGGPLLPDLRNSYVAVVVTGAVARASQPIVLEASTNLVCWAPIATNSLVAGHGKFWLGTPTSMSWVIFYDYRWSERPLRFYRIQGRP